MPRAKGFRRPSRSRLRAILMTTIAALSLLAGSAAADEQKIELLWPAGAPGAKGDKPDDKPTLTIFPAPKDHNSGAAAVIIPGGGYGAVGMEREGFNTARLVNTLGVSAFVLNYRHAGRGYQYPAPIDDGIRAMRTVRARAAEWGVDPHKIGVIGYSAGGHLASTVGTHFDAGKSDAKDPIEAARAAGPIFSCWSMP